MLLTPWAICSSPDSSGNRIFQARMLEWVAISFLRRSSWPRHRTRVSCMAGRFFTDWATRKAPKWIGMGEFNSDDHYVYYCGQESLRANGVAITVNKSPKCSTWMQSQKRQNDLCSFSRQTIQYHSNPSLCPDLQDLLELTPQKRFLYIIWNWDAKVGSQEILE